MFIGTKKIPRANLEDRMAMQWKWNRLPRRKGDVMENAFK